MEIFTKNFWEWTSIFLNVIFYIKSATMAHLPIISKCPMEFFRGENPIACQQFPKYPNKNILLKSICPHQSPFINFHSKGKSQKYFSPSIYWFDNGIIRNNVKKIMHKTGINLTSDWSKDWIGIWLHTINSKRDCQQLNQHPYRKYNQIPGIRNLGFKHLLTNHLNEAMRKHGIQNLPFLLPSFNLPQAKRQLFELMDKSPENIWVLKPPLAAKSYGIKFVRTKKDVQRYLKNIHWPGTKLVAQKYVNDPYLYKNRKIVSRVYLFITSFEPLRLYALKDGHTYIAFQNFTQDFSELTNHCIHIPLQSGIYGGTGKCRNEESLSMTNAADVENKYSITLKSLFKHLSNEDHNVSTLWEKIEDMAIQTVLSTKQAIHRGIKSCFPYPYNVYQEIVLEFMLDKNLNPYLIESNPVFSKRTKTRMSYLLKTELAKASLTIAGFHPPPQFLKFHALPTSLSYGYNKTVEPNRKRILPKKGNILKSSMNPSDIRQLLIGEDELMRSWGLKRLFPSFKMDRYSNYFKGTPFNHNFQLQLNWEKMMKQNRSKGQAFLAKKCSVLIGKSNEGKD